jgi:cation:H+ antiporter
LFFALGLVTLVFGAQVLIRGASKLALSFGVSPLVLGLTIVAFGTSAPELAVSVRSAWGGQVDIALGNAVGSNIFNVLFILGLSALIAPLVVAPQLIRQEVPIMLGASVLLFALALDGGISRTGRGAAVRLARHLHRLPDPAEPQGDPEHERRIRGRVRRAAGPGVGSATGAFSSC